MSGGRIKKIFSISCIIISIVMVLYIVFSTDDIPKTLQALTTLDMRFFTLGVLGFFGFVGMEGLGLYLFLKLQKYSISYLTALHFSFLGIFYANITPSASGGQPMQVLLMSERNIPVSDAVSGLTVRFVFNQAAVVTSTLVLILTHLPFFNSHLAGVHGFIYLGLSITALPILLVLLVAFNATRLNHVAATLIDFLARKKIIKKPEKITNSVLSTLTNYKTSMQSVSRHPVHLLLQFMISLVQYFCLLMVPLAVHAALSQPYVNPGDLLTASYSLFSSVNYTPLPGSSGAQEGGFLLYFKGLFTSDIIPVALLLWRFITYYLSLILGCVYNMISAFIKHHPIHQEKNK